MKTVPSGVINVHVDPKDKEEAMAILKDLGLNMTTLINMTLKQVIKRKAVPFEISNPRPSKKLLKAIKEGENILDGKTDAKSYTNMYEMLKDLKS